ncbi:molybdopterin oxidoreductase family protein [Chondromyces apiculatus]|uniref:Formate dehydrogenase-O, major subunit n=1 Tax=Chondromyces apiculatus DSM 436 TaxID=1192034 RepID=A0A017T4Y9_9BACT|nr:molybdopterin oxidoreductase family protein [Chondromyces apiculatus]EYF03616.1 Formate dehydrogenase-O, major subunit [Chondromyces apiculatus DSM 436]
MSTSPDARLHHRTCSLCEAMCGVEIETEGERVIAIRGDKADPFSQGYLCPKATGLQDIHEDPDRLRHPVRRVKGGWERVGWDEAFDEVAARLKDIQARHGRDAVGFYAGNPSVHSIGALLFGPPFLRSLRTRNRFSATSVDQLPHQLAALLMFGHQLLVPIPDVDRTDFFLVIGANPVVSNGSLMSAPGMPRRLQAIRDRGGRVVVVDPRRTETAERADEHHFIRPGTDVLLLLALLHEIFASSLAAPGRLAGFVEGLPTLEQAVRPFPPERAAATTGVPAEVIRRLAREFASTPRATVYARMGASTQPFGGLCIWLVNALNVVTGSLDREGGAMFTLPAIDIVGMSARSSLRGHHDRRRSRVRGLPEFSGEFPVATLADEILTEGAGQIRALVTAAGNPVLSTPNGRRLDDALASLDFMASIDFYINETTRHAHLILPPTGPLERDHYDLIFHVLAVRNTAKFAPALFAPADDARHDWQILGELTARMEARPGLQGRLAAGARKAVLRRLTPRHVLDLGLRTGPYGVRRGLRDSLSLGALERAPHGIDLGPLAPCLPERLITPDKRIHLAPEPLLQDLARVEATFPSDAPDAPDALGAPGTSASGALMLIGRRQLRSNNSWMHNSHRLVKGRDRCTALMHPEDAARRSLTNGQRIRVSSRVGSVEVALEISDEIMPGVISIPHGWGHDRAGIRLGVASRHAGVSVNDLTDEHALDALTGNAALNGVPVQVEAAAPGPQPADGGTRPPDITA